jgi:hypothetical protein
MFELQPCNYYEGFSQCFCILDRSKTKKVKFHKNYTFKFNNDVMLKYICAKKYMS